MRTITGLAALAALSAIATPAAAARPKTPKADNRPPFSAQDLVTLPRLGAAAVNADGALAVYPLTETEPESLKRSTALFARSLTDARAKPVRLDLAVTHITPACSDAVLVEIKSEPFAGGEELEWAARGP
jgi:hypothetical protein